MQIGQYTARPYQERTFHEARQRIAQGERRLLVVSPTGSGKTLMASLMIRSALQKGRKALFLADRRILVNQCSRKLTECDVPHSVLMAGYKHYATPVTVASRDTMYSRCFPKGKRIPEPLPEADLVIVDEAHMALGPSYMQIFEAYPDAVIVGYTATPCRSDGRGLGELFGEMIQSATYQELIEYGCLVRTRCFAPSVPDLSGVKVDPDGDYNEDELSSVMNAKELVGDIVDSWRKHARLPNGGYRKTVVFASSIAHSLHLLEKFREAGVSASHMDGGTPPAQRKVILDNLENGTITLVTNCQVLDTGWDQPAVSCCVLAKPTTSIARFRQMAGRIQRPCPGKDDAVLIDHSGNVLMHGFPDDDLAVEWTLDGTVAINVRDHNVGDDGEITPPDPNKKIGCPECGAERLGGAVCPNCGFHRERKGKDVVNVPGKLKELDRDFQKITRHPDQVQWNKCLGIAAHSRMNFFQAMKMFEKKAGHQPSTMLDFRPMKAETLSKRVCDVFPGFARRKKKVS